MFLESFAKCSRMLGITSSRFAAASQTYADGGHQHRAQHTCARDSGCQERGHFVMALDPGDRKHHGNEREHAAGAIEKSDATVGVILAHDLQQVAMLTGIVDEVVEVAEGIDHDVQPNETHQADDEHLDELPQTGSDQ